MSQSTIEGVDVETLLAAVSEAEPAGADLREDFTPQSPYYRLRDARAEARAAERAADSTVGESATPPEWRTVRDVALLALQSSKDLEVAAWLTEALLRSDGLLGLQTGCVLMTGLVERFWDGLYPRPDEDGVATKVAPVAGLNGEEGDGTLIQPLRKVVLFNRPDTSPMPFWQYEQSRELEGIGDADRRKRRLEAGVLPLDAVENEARAAGAPWFSAQYKIVTEAAAAWRLLGAALDGKAGSDSPSTGRVRDLLDAIAEAIARYKPSAEEEAASAELETLQAAEPGGGLARSELGSGERMSTREDALRQLDLVAAWFRRNEPNSPLYYTLQEAARRGRLTWPELLAEIVQDPTSRAAILTGLGIKPPTEE